MPETQGRSPLWSHAYGGVQLTVTVLLGLYAGHWLDKKWDSSPWLMLIGAAMGCFLGLYSFLKPFLSSHDSKK